MVHSPASGHDKLLTLSDTTLPSPDASSAVGVPQVPFTSVTTNGTPSTVPVVGA
jgi:hypothetical protein